MHFSTPSLSTPSKDQPHITNRELCLLEPTPNPSLEGVPQAWLLLVPGRNEETMFRKSEYKRADEVVHALLIQKVFIHQSECHIANMGLPHEEGVLIGDRYCTSTSALKIMTQCLDLQTHLPVFRNYPTTGYPAISLPTKYRGRCVHYHESVFDPGHELRQFLEIRACENLMRLVRKGRSPTNGASCVDTCFGVFVRAFLDQDGVQGVLPKGMILSFGIGRYWARDQNKGCPSDYVIESDGIPGISNKPNDPVQKTFIDFGNYRTIASFVNDYRGLADKPNCQIVQDTQNIFYIETLEEIQAGRQLLTNYHDKYWKEDE